MNQKNILFKKNYPLSGVTFFSYGDNNKPATFAKPVGFIVLFATSPKTCKINYHKSKDLSVKRQQVWTLAAY